ncbi:fibronectin type III domain-containing protein [Candidatus Gracilibacteria bacterium]|nr:fibronectin type III domain-containing protein [Candidatus Gracilibacteria bacterium]
MFNKKEFLSKIISSFRGVLFFGAGVLLAGIGYAVLNLTIGEKQDNLNDDAAGRLRAGEFNQILGLTRGLSNDNGNIGIGMDPEYDAKLQVGGDVIATGSVESSSDVTVTGSVILGVNIAVPDELCEDGFVMDGFEEDGSISCVEIPTVEARITSFTASPSAADYNTSVTLDWTHENVSTCTLSCTDGCPDSWVDIVDTADNTVDTGDLTEEASFDLDCDGSIEGTDSASLIVSINPATVELTSSQQQVARGGSVTLSWETGSAINCQGTGGGAWAGDKDPSGGSEVINNINNDTTYTIRCNGVGNQYDEDAVTVTVIEQADVPGGVVVFNATSGNTQVTLSWIEPDNGGSPITGYRIERDPGDGTWWLVSNPGANDTSYTDMGLINGNTYQYRIRATNLVGNGIWSETVSAIPNPPENLGVTLDYVVKQDVEAGMQQPNLNGQYPLYDQGWVELEWETTGNPISCTASDNNQNLWTGNKNTAGGSETISYRDVNIGHQDVITYSITCSDGVSPDVNASVSVQKNQSFAWWQNWQNLHFPVFGANDVELNSESQWPCATPRGIACQTTDGTDWRDAGQNYTCRRDGRDTAGGYCYSIDNGNSCLDYKINILCAQQW